MSDDTILKFTPPEGVPEPWRTYGAFSAWVRQDIDGGITDANRNSYMAEACLLMSSRIADVATGLMVAMNEPEKFAEANPIICRDVGLVAYSAICLVEIMGNNLLATSTTPIDDLVDARAFHTPEQVEGARFKAAYWLEILAHFTAATSYLTGCHGAVHAQLYDSNPIKPDEFHKAIGRGLSNIHFMLSMLGLRMSDALKAAHDLGEGHGDTPNENGQG